MSPGARGTAAPDRRSGARHSGLRRHPPGDRSGADPDSGRSDRPLAGPQDHQGDGLPRVQDHQGHGAQRGAAAGQVRRRAPGRHRGRLRARQGDPAGHHGLPGGRDRRSHGRLPDRCPGGLRPPAAPDRRVSVRRQGRGDLLGSHGREHRRVQLAIVLDEQVYSAPNIKSRIGTRGQIEGRFTMPAGGGPGRRAAGGLALRARHHRGGADGRTDARRRLDRRRGFGHR